MRRLLRGFADRSFRFSGSSRRIIQDFFFCEAPAPRVLDVFFNIRTVEGRRRRRSYRDVTPNVRRVPYLPCDLSLE